MIDVNVLEQMATAGDTIALDPADTPVKMDADLMQVTPLVTRDKPLMRGPAPGQVVQIHRIFMVCACADEEGLQQFYSSRKDVFSDLWIARKRGTNYTRLTSGTVTFDVDISRCIDKLPVFPFGPDDQPVALEIRPTNPLTLDGDLGDKLVVAFGGDINDNIPTLWVVLGKRL